MIRSERDWLDDILESISAIDRYMARGDLHDELIFDGCLHRLMEIGEAAKHLDVDLFPDDPEVPWSRIAGMRDFITHHYFDIDPEVVHDTITTKLEPLRAAVESLIAGGENVPITDSTSSIWEPPSSDFEGPGFV